VVDSGFLPCRCHMLRNICRGLNTGACAKVRNLRDMRYAKLQMMDLIACGGTLAEGKRQSVKVDKEKCKHNKRENASKKETNKKKQHSTRNLTSTGGAQNKASTVPSQFGALQRGEKISGIPTGSQVFGWGPPEDCLRQPGAPQAISFFPLGFRNLFEHKTTFAQFFLRRTAR
jgi:hypothetical protein